MFRGFTGRSDFLRLPGDESGARQRASGGHSQRRAGTERIAAAGGGHVLFHGGIDSRARAKLVDRFRDDPECRIFLSTDAGGVGLNLQHASVVINVDLPWNPAVLEQRIGRVHRIGQRAPVRVVNFAAEGTIEQGMLSVLRFKKAFSPECSTAVFLGKGRLDRFMESIAQGLVGFCASVGARLRRVDGDRRGVRGSTHRFKLADINEAIASSAGGSTA